MGDLPVGLESTGPLELVVYAVVGLAGKWLAGRGESRDVDRAEKAQDKLVGGLEADGSRLTDEVTRLMEQRIELMERLSEKEKVSAVDIAEEVADMLDARDGAVVDVDTDEF